MEQRLKINNQDFGEFLKAKRQSLSPTDVGLPTTQRRRTRGLRREEVAHLAGVGLTWYTWAEQGRDIHVSNSFLNNISRALKLDYEEQRHLFQLAGHYPEINNTVDHCILPNLIRQLLDDLVLRPSYVMNLHWNILGWNNAGNILFKFDTYEKEEKNMLWMLFADTQLSSRIKEWEKHAPLIIASFRRDYIHINEKTTIDTMITSLQLRSPLFKRLWNKHEVQGKCQGTRTFHVNGIGDLAFDHKTLIADVEKQMRFVYYVAQSSSNLANEFHKMVMSD